MKRPREASEIPPIDQRPAKRGKPNAEECEAELKISYPQDFYFQPDNVKALEIGL